MIFSSGIYLVMTVIGCAVSTMFMIFVCSRLVCARIQLNASRQQRSLPTTNASRSDFTIVERGIHGMEPVVVATFPTKKFSDDFFASGEDSQCTVCLAEYQKKDIIRILPYCRHYFHVTCIDIWLQQHATCPVCRISLRDSPERKSRLQSMYSRVIRPHGMDSLDAHSNHCLYSDSGRSSRSADNSRMEPIQEDQLASELDAAEAGESSSSTESIQNRRDIGRHDSETGSSRVHPLYSNP